MKKTKKEKCSSKDIIKKEKYPKKAKKSMIKKEIKELLNLSDDNENDNKNKNIEKCSSNV